MLERAKLISRGKTAQWRPCRLETAPLQDVDGWLTDYRKLWEHRLDRLESYVTNLQASNGDKDEKDEKKP